MKPSNIFTGTPNGKYLESYELYNPKPSLVLMETFKNHFIILEICENPLKAIQRRNDLVTENEGMTNTIKVHWNN